mmetsp:Transcript_12138/g.15896  ORF Transcript_12138/g.15896 Transcript_12138/m.15896 type:complete len:85 (+) Transcript_12138:310-564(+)
MHSMNIPPFFFLVFAVFSREGLNCINNQITESSINILCRACSFSSQKFSKGCCEPMYLGTDSSSGVVSKQDVSSGFAMGGIYGA